MMKSRLLSGFAAVVCLSAAGCGEFNDGKTRNILEANPVRLDAEQVMLTYGQVNCGVQNELWDPPYTINEATQRANLTSAGRQLKFDDSVSVSEPGYRQPYVQVRGEFQLGVLDIINTKDGPDKDTKLVDIKVGVKIGHPCFPNPLPILGLRKGQFSEDYPPVLLFRLDRGWQLDKFVH